MKIRHRNKRQQASLDEPHSVTAEEYTHSDVNADGHIIFQEKTPWKSPELTLDPPPARTFVERLHSPTRA